MNRDTALAIKHHLTKNKMAFCYGEQGQFYTIGEINKTLGLVCPDCGDEKSFGFAKCQLCFQKEVNKTYIDNRNLEYPANMFYQPEKK